MIGAAAFCPQPPRIVPDVARGAAGELADLADLCRTAIAGACPAGRLPILVGAGPVSRLFAPPLSGSLAGFGPAVAVRLGATDPDDPAEPDALPASLVIGAWLTAGALGPDRTCWACSVGPDFAGSAAETALHAMTQRTMTPTTPRETTPRETAGPVDAALLVFADGSARRSTTAPGYLDDRAEPFDAGVAHALASGDPAAVQALDADLGAALLAGGVPAWHAAAGLLAGRSYRARLDYAQAPFGVGYFVARWTAAGD